MKLAINVPTAIGASALLCLTILASCGQPVGSMPAAADPTPASPTSPRGSTPIDGRDPLAAAKSPSGSAAVTAEVQAAQDREDDVRARSLAPDLMARPDWLARQQALCGPGNGTLQARYAALRGPASQDLRDLKVACLAKDIAEREGRERGAGGVKNTGTL